MMDILELIRKDHEKALSVFDELEQMDEKSAKKDNKQEKVFSRLRQELEAHMAGEETVFYPALMENEDDRAMVLQAIEEHHVASLLLEELGGAPRDERWTAKLAVLRENVERHIDEEEGEIFSEAEDMFDEEQRKDMGRRMGEIKKEHLASVTGHA